MKYFKRVKDDSVRLDGVTIQMYFAWGVVCTVYRHHLNLANCVVTSANDGTHMSNSRHYIGDALDFRVWGWDAEQIANVVEHLQLILGDEYVVVNELDHIHVEYERTAE